MKQIAVFLAEGFEEIEGLTVTDLLRRAGVTVTNVSVTGEKTVHGSHGIGVEADALFEEMEFEGMDMLVLPGGMPGTRHLKEHRDLCVLLKEFYAKERYLAAICAAPTDARHSLRLLRSWIFHADDSSRLPASHELPVKWIRRTWLLS